MTESTIRGDVFRTQLPSGGMQVIVAIHHPKNDGSKGEVAHYEVHCKPHIGAKTEFRKLFPEEAQQLFEKFNIKPVCENEFLPIGNGKIVRDTQRYAEHMPKMNYKTKPKGGKSHAGGHSKSKFTLTKAIVYQNSSQQS